MSAEDDAKKVKIATYLKWIGGFLGLAALSPVIFLALKGALGLIALAVTAGVGVVMIRLTPVISLKISNGVIKLLVSEAARNPIETMEGLKIEKTKELAEADTAIVDFETEVRNYDDQTDEFSVRYPEEAPTYQEISSQMHAALEQQKQEQEDARAKLDDLGQRIEKARAIYKMSLAAQKVTSLSKSAASKVYAEIREKVAFESVRTELNRSFAQLSNTIAARKSAQSRPALPAPSAVPSRALPAKPEVIEFPATTRDAAESRRRS